jgi:thiosulfate/3-mercaptopyruvate sulfurtransferase
MSYRTLIAVDELRALQDAAAPLVLLDCSFDLADPGRGERTHAAGHLPGALYVHLDRDLSAPKHPEGPRSPRFTGRHPLPARGDLAALAGRLGIAPGVQVACFDGEGGPYAARAWWLLRWLGHAEVAVLDGGIGAWRAAGLPLTAAAATPRPAPPYPDRAPAMPAIDAAALLARLGSVRIVDARSAARFAGREEPLDPVAGHIPGAVHRFFLDPLGPDGRFKPAAQLRAELAALAAGGVPVVHQCGSGVTACHNLLAMEHAGLPGSALYPGSWSEWCADPSRPVERA